MFGGRLIGSRYCAIRRGDKVLAHEFQLEHVSCHHHQLRGHRHLQADWHRSGEERGGAHSDAGAQPGPHEGLLPEGSELL